MAARSPPSTNWVNRGPGPSPSRWTLRTIRATFEIFGGMTLGGVWRALKGRFGIALRSGAVQHDSPDPEYATKYDYLIKCLNEATTMPDRVALVFLDEMGYTRWPEPGPDWAAAPPAPPHRSRLCQRRSRCRPARLAPARRRG